MRKRSLRGRWTLAMLLAALAPLAVASALVLPIQREGLMDAERELEIAVVDAAARELSNQLREAESTVHRAAALLSDARIAEDARLSLAEDALGSAEVVAWVAVFGPTGEPLGAVEKLGGERPDPRLDLELGGAQQPRWVRRESGAMRYVEPIVRDGAVTGWVLGGISADVLSRAVVDLSRDRFGRTDRVYVVDRDRAVVAGDPAVFPRGAPLPGDHALSGVGIDRAAYDKAVAVHRSFVGAGGAPMSGTIRVLSEQELAVVVERPEAEAFATIARSRRAFGASALVLALVAVVVGAVVARRTTEPVEQLVELARAYGRRELDKRSAVRSNDELEVLGEAMGAMAEDLSASEAEIRRRAAVEAALARYLPAEVARAVAGGEDVIDLAGRRMVVSVLFADVAAFTPFVERAQPEKVVALLNELFALLSEIVFRHGGMVDKFMGDSVMAIFGVRARGDGDHAAQALAAAGDMHRFVASSAARYRRLYDVEVRLGIGVATGEALVGNLGSDERMEFTAVGDSVNVASRLEALAQPGQTLVTSVVAESAKDAFEIRPLGAHPLRGKAEPVEVFEVRA